MEVDTEARTYEVLSSSGKIITGISKGAIEMNKTLCDLLEFTEDDAPIPCNIPTEILRGIIQFSEYHAKHEVFIPYEYDERGNMKVLESQPRIEERRQPLSEKDAAIVGDMNMETLCKWMNAANILNNRYMLDVLGKQFSIMIKGKTVDELRALFGVSECLPQEVVDMIMTKYSQFFPPSS